MRSLFRSFMAICAIAAIGLISPAAFAAPAPDEIILQEKALSFKADPAIVIYCDYAQTPIPKLERSVHMITASLTAKAEPLKITTVAFHRRC